MKKKLDRNTSTIGGTRRATNKFGRPPTMEEEDLANEITTTVSTALAVWRQEQLLPPPPPPPPPPALMPPWLRGIPLPASPEAPGSTGRLASLCGGLSGQVCRSETVRRLLWTLAPPFLSAAAFEGAVLACAAARRGRADRVVSPALAVLCVAAMCAERVWREGSTLGEWALSPYGAGALASLAGYVAIAVPARLWRQLPLRHRPDNPAVPLGS